MVYFELSTSRSRRIVAYAAEMADMAQNRQQPEDLQVRRTRKLLMQALIELTIEKGFAAIYVLRHATPAYPRIL
jgi:hypothetical protein